MMRAVQPRHLLRSGLFLSALSSFLGVALVAGVAGAQTAPAESRTFRFDYSVVVGRVPQGSGPVSVFVPLARTSEAQRVLDEEIQASIPGEVAVEETYGNRFWHGTVERSSGVPIRVRVTTTVQRKIAQIAPPPASPPLTAAEKEELARFLGPNARVVVDHPILDPIRAEVREKADREDPAALSRATYDWVVGNIEYKKVGRGWGNGDTFWACNERYGNCTDFHALFISLVRGFGIPARFEIGFPIPEDRPAGEIGGYHCWVEVYLPARGWFPVDASEASKHPEKREHFYGTRPADRIHFTTGRDLRLGAAHRGPPLNYFVYPYVEVGGKPWKGEVEKSFSFSPASLAQESASQAPAR